MPLLSVRHPITVSTALVCSFSLTLVGILSIIRAQGVLNSRLSMIPASVSAGVSLILLGQGAAAGVTLPLVKGKGKFNLNSLVGKAENVYLIGDKEQLALIYKRYSDKLLLHVYNGCHAQECLTGRDYIVFCHPDGELSGWNARTWGACRGDLGAAPRVKELFWDRQGS